MRLLFLAVILALTLSARAVLARDLDKDRPDGRTSTEVGECRQLTAPNENDIGRELVLRPPVPVKILKLSVGKGKLKGVLLETAGLEIVRPMSPPTTEYPGATFEWEGRFQAKASKGSPCKLSFTGKGGVEVGLEREPTLETEFVKDLSGTQKYSGTIKTRKYDKPVNVECWLKEAELARVVACGDPVPAAKREEDAAEKRVEPTQTLDETVIVGQPPAETTKKPVRKKPAK